MAKKTGKKQALKVEPPLLKPSEALTRLKPQAFEASEAEERIFEQVRYGFELGAIGVLIPVGMVCEVMDAQRVYLLPNAPAWILGLVNLRGNLIPAFDLAGLLRVEDTTDAKNSDQPDLNMLVIGSDVKAVAITIKGLPQPVPTERREPELPPIAESAKTFVINAYSHQKRVWIDLDLEAYLMSLRRQRLA